MVVFHNHTIIFFSGKGVLAVKGINASRDNTISWLKNQRYIGWGRNAHRAITALYLAQGASFRGPIVEEELMAKQLELQTSVALLRWVFNVMF